MKPSEVIAVVTEALTTIAPVLDEIAAMVEGGSLSPAGGALKAFGAINDHYGKIGDGHILQILIQYAPQIIAIIQGLITGGGIKPPVPAGA